jgi:hypothetical protein
VLFLKKNNNSNELRIFLVDRAIEIYKSDNQLKTYQIDINLIGLQDLVKVNDTLSSSC